MTAVTYAGLSINDWHLLKNLVLAAGERHSSPITIPAHLMHHKAALHLQAFLTSGAKNELDEAARALCPQYPEQAWLALMKS